MQEQAETLLKGHAPSCPRLLVLTTQLLNFSRHGEFVRWRTTSCHSLATPKPWQWSERGERHGRRVGIATWAECLAVERSGSCRDTRRLAISRISAIVCNV